MSPQFLKVLHRCILLIITLAILGGSLPMVSLSAQGDDRNLQPTQELYLPALQSQSVAAPGDLSSENTVAAGSRPNIVFIITDDQPYHMQQFLPQTNSRIGAKGVTFTRAFAEDPLCCPSRTSILTGQYARTHNNIGNGSPYGGAEVWHNRGGDQSTIATWLQAAGYRTGIFGKYMNAVKPLGSTVPPGWNDWYVFEDGDIWINGVRQEDGIDGEGYYNYYLSDNGRRLTFLDSPNEYGTDVITRRTLSFIRQTPAEQPIFVYYSVRAPHIPAFPAPQDEGTMASIPRYRPPNYNEADVSDKPPWIKRLAPLTNGQMSELDALYVDMAESLQAVDRGVEAIVNEIWKSGRLSNTVFIFTSDHGFSLGEHRYSRKECIYEECIRVPLLVRAPGVSPRTDDHLISLADIAPTLAELAGVTPPIPVDGMSFAPLLYNPQAPWRRTLLIESLSREPQADRNLHGVRTGRYVYAELQSGFAELYDLQNDPYQLDNIASNPAFASVVSDMKSRLNGFKFVTDLFLTQIASTTSTASVSRITYAITVKNNGPRAAHSITIDNPLPADVTFVSCLASGDGVCGGTGHARKVLYRYLGVNETRTVTFVADVKPSVSSGTVIHNRASISALTSTDAEPENNSATTSITIQSSPQQEVIFADGFETGNFSAWSNFTADHGDLTSHTSAALVQTWGLKALIDDNSPIGVRDERPLSEVHYRARFYFDPNSIMMGNEESHVIFFGYGEMNPSQPLLRIDLKFSNGNYQVRTSLMNDGNTWRYSSWFTISDATHFLELEWRASTAAGSNDGGLNLWIDGIQRANLAGVDNDTRRIDYVRLGALAGIDSGTGGTYYFDAFEARRFNYIGAAPNAPTLATTADESSIDPAELTAYTESSTNDPEEKALLREAMAQEEEAQSEYEVRLPLVNR